MNQKICAWIIGHDADIEVLIPFFFLRDFSLISYLKIILLQEQTKKSMVKRSSPWKNFGFGRDYGYWQRHN